MVHPIAEQLVHLPHAATAVEWGHVEIAAVEVEGRDDVVADHVQPCHLLFVEFLAASFVARHDPRLEVAADGIPVRQKR